MSTENAQDPSNTEAEPTAADFEADDPADNVSPEGQEAAPPSSETASDDETVSQEDGEQQEELSPGIYDHAPEFWSAERKAIWERINDPAVRQAIHEQDKERTDGISKKLMESAEETKKAKANEERFTQERQMFGSYLEKMMPQWAAAFRGKYEGVDEVKFASEYPAEYAKWQAERNRDQALLQQAENARQQEAKALQQRQEADLNQNRLVEHDKLTKLFPKHFGAEQLSQKTFDDLGGYLRQQGIPQERINVTYEAPIVGIALKAMLYDKAQAALKAKAQGQSATATQTPTRVAPGARQMGQPNESEANRQAEKRLRTGQNLSDADVERLFG